MAEKPSFRAAFKKRRCIVLADGYYERKQGTKLKQPYLFHFEDDRPFALAGLWECWGKGSSPVETCTIITTSPSPLSVVIHDRMPVILDDTAIDRWLDPQTADAAKITQLIRPFEDPAFVIDPVSTLVNNPTHEDPRCVEPTRLP